MNLPFDSKHKENNYRKTILENGVTVVSEEISYFHSVSIGIWVRSGSRYEPPDLNGICHFIEHMLFKGTDMRSAFEIAKEIDAVGGVLNAFTSKEMTSFFCRVLHENLDLAVDLLGDIFLNASFPEDEIEREKQVICQEIHQLEDSPEDLVHEILGVSFWRDDPLGQPILGTIPNIVKLDRSTMVDFKRNYYSPDETVICAAGKLEHDRLVELFSNQITKLSKGLSPPSVLVPRPQPHSEIVERDLEQVHLCLGMEAPSAINHKRHAAYILNTIIGGSMSSRLFQEIREKRGLAYSVYSFLSSFSDTGLFGIYAGCDPERLDETLTVMAKEILELTNNLTEDELAAAKSQLKGNIILAMESTESRMNRLAKGEFYFGRYIPLDEILSSLEAVTISELLEVAEEMLDPDSFTIVALGPVDRNKNLLDFFQN